MKKYLPGLSLWITAIGLSIFIFQNLVLQPNSVMTTIGHDGMKNYFSTLYYIHYDSGTHFSGMNYPFGENILYTDNMPLFSYVMQHITTWIPGLKPYTLGLMHLFLFASVPVSAYFIFKILRRFRTGAIYAVIAALFITFISPQLNKLSAHFGMGIVFYCPAVIYCLMLYFDTQKIKYLVFIFGIAAFVTFIHFYNVAIISVFVGFTAIARFITDKKASGKERLQQPLRLLLLAAINLAPAFLYLKLTDPVTDRATYPWGVLTMETIPNDLLVNATPLGYIFQFAVGKVTGIGATDGKSYIGLVSILVLLFMTGIWLYRKFRKEANPLLRAQPIPGFNIWLWAAFFQLLFAMATPMHWARDFVADNMSLFRQFRTIGRFVWPFYYLFMIYSALFVYHYYSLLLQKGKTILARLLITSVVLTWTVQTTGYIKMWHNIAAEASNNYNLLFDKNDTNWKDWLAQRGYDPDDFQAILGLPYFNCSSEKIWIMDVNENNNIAAFSKYALQTCTPLINNILSRTSWSQTFEAIQIIDGPFNKKKILDRYNDKDIIILLDKTTPLKDTEQEWIAQATFIGDRNDAIAVYTINPKVLQSHDQEYRQKITDSVMNLDMSMGLLNNADNNFYYINNFEQYNDKKGFADKGMFIPRIANGELVDNFTVPATARRKEYTISLWAQCNRTDYRTAYFEVYQYDAGRNQTAFYDFAAKKSTNVQEDWFLAEGTFKIDATTSSIKIQVYSNGKKISYRGLDNLLIQPRHSIFYYKPADNTLFLNNRPQ
ncbi:MAG: hypothetical protein EOP54_13365 [Sphingobacteriales bacterium]|nr:MAG: hypothetical protein EOP54_13365 [Sphingobacteriales bacterium]